MKKILLLAAIALSAITASAQTERPVSLRGSKFFDNWSITLKGGAINPMNRYDYWSHTHGVLGLELRKQITPVIGVGAEGEWTINTAANSEFTFDNQYVGAFTAFNLMNMFGGYNGMPRVFEIEAVGGVGWLRSYHANGLFADGNSWATKAGLNFNFNFGPQRSWTASIKPAVIYNMNGSAKVNDLGYAAQYNANHAYVELEAGLTYHFKNSNGTHSFEIIKPMDLDLVNSLNEQINDLRNQIAACEGNTAALQAQLAELERQLDACLKSAKAPCQTVVKGLNNKYYVFYRVNSSRIEPMQQAQVELVANALKANPGSTVLIKGYASKDGNLSYNERLAQKRADAVKNELVKKYGIEASRIEAKGEGISELFDRLGWNRFADCQIKLAE